MRKLFGTDGVRGVANLDPMTSEMAMQLGRAAAHLFMRRAGRHQIVIGKDTRISGYMLESALTSGICSMGVDVLLVGPLPTPAIAFLTRSLRADAGVMISASHNPYQDNGIKFFSNDGFKLPDEMEARIESSSSRTRLPIYGRRLMPLAKPIESTMPRGGISSSSNGLSRRSLDFQGIKVVVDCANGAAYKVAPTVLRELGAKVEVIGNKPDGMNINAGCGAVHPELLQTSGSRAGGPSRSGAGRRCRSRHLCLRTGERRRRRSYYGDVGARSSSQGTAGQADSGGDRHEQLRIGAGHDESAVSP